MVFAYMIGIILFVALYFIMGKIGNFLDPYPPRIPTNKEDEKINKCTISINGKEYKCLKITHISKTYGYSEDCDVIEWENRFLKYELCDRISETPKFIDKYCCSLMITDSGKGIECYMADDLKTFISVNPIERERIYAYRKPEILRKFSIKRKRGFQNG